MDDSCAVCAESLEWVAYGACGHKDVCSTCVARLRFICDDRRCCICKTECNVVFVTKAMGDYTRTINDFSQLPSEVKEGRVGQYWCHEDTQAIFDDLDHYKMIKAMCRLSCSECDRMEEQPDDGPRRRAKFRNIEQLKGHLFHKHKLFMCSLCLEGRKIFICEQKLYTRSQLTQHTNTGDSEVDGTESERGGFAGHPMCEFCRTPFYGDNELYTHMSTEHYTCHMCQRQNPGQYEYYKNYDDLEIHFRRGHFLCEDEGCLAKKFIVFLSEGELKRHNAMEHGGRMSRSERSAALQIPTSFRYRRASEQDNRRGRGRSFRRDPSDNELSMAIQASLDTASAAASSSSRPITGREESTNVESLSQPLESVAITESESSARYRQALSLSSGSGTLVDSSFPPLAVGSVSNQQNSIPKKSMAAHLRRQSNKKANSSSSAPAWSAASLTRMQAVNGGDAWPSINAVSGSASSSGKSRPVAEIGSTSSSGKSRPVAEIGSASSSGKSRPVAEIGSASLSYSTSAQARPPSIATSSFAGSLTSSRASGGTIRMSHSSSAPNLSERESLVSSSTDFPPVSATRKLPSPSANQAITKVEDVQTANKSLVEKMRIALGFDEDKFTAFKELSGEYRQGSMDAEIYLAHAEQFGLSHLVPELARLLPNAQKQKELIDVYNASKSNGFSSSSLKGGNGSKKGKGKGKAVDTSNSSVKSSLADNVISTLKELQSSYRPSEEDVEVLTKDGYRTAKDKSKVKVDESVLELSRPGESSKQKGQTELLSAGGGATNNSANGDGKSKPKKKSKFHRVRLGDGSIEALLDLKNGGPDSDPGPNSNEATSDGASNSVDSLPARGVWRNGGGQKLLGITSKGPKK